MESRENPRPFVVALREDDRRPLPIAEEEYSLRRQDPDLIVLNLGHAEGTIHALNLPFKYRRMLTNENEIVIMPPNEFARRFLALRNREQRETALEALLSECKTPLTTYQGTLQIKLLRLKKNASTLDLDERLQQGAPATVARILATQTVLDMIRREFLSGDELQLIQDLDNVLQTSRAKLDTIQQAIHEYEIASPSAQ